MSNFHYLQNELYAESVNIQDIITRYGTPIYIYSRAGLESNWQHFNNAFAEIPHQICYAVKANSNIAILNLFAKLNSGFDIVSVGELERVLAAGGDPHKIVFSGVGKKANEIKRALEVGIYCFNVESVVELARIDSIAKQMGTIANIALRINPNIDAKTHPFIATGLKENKFGIDYDKALPICRDVVNMRNVNLIGIACHIGSQVTELSPFLDSVDRMLELVEQMFAEQIKIEHLNIGGGLGVRYLDETPPSVNAYAQALCEKLKGHRFKILLEPGRIITADAGILVTQIEYLKHTSFKNFAIVDAAMNDLMRPALYNAWQQILPVKLHKHLQEETYDIVGPVCESADFLGRDRRLALNTGDLLAITGAGAYGFAMSSNYNSRGRAAEVLVDNNKFHLIRARETIESLFANETLI